MDKRPWTVALLAIFAGLPAIVPAAAVDSHDLRIYFIDVEGGQSTLFVTPAGQSLLIDTGSPNNDGRDADRILAATKSAGISKIDYVLLTHYHADHSGGVAQLVARVPVGAFIDHGPNIEPGGTTPKVYAAYQQLLGTGKYKHIVAQPGDVLAITGMKVTRRLGVERRR